MIIGLKGGPINMCIKHRKHVADNITLGMARLFVQTAHGNMIFMGQGTLLPISQAFRNPPDVVLPDGQEEEFSDDEGEEWKLSD